MDASGTNEPQKAARAKDLIQQLLSKLHSQSIENERLVSENDELRRTIAEQQQQLARKRASENTNAVQAATQTPPRMALYIGDYIGVDEQQGSPAAADGDGTFDGAGERECEGDANGEYRDETTGSDNADDSDLLLDISRALHAIDHGQVGHQGALPAKGGALDASVGAGARQQHEAGDDKCDDERQEHPEG